MWYGENIVLMYFNLSTCLWKYYNGSWANLVIFKSITLPTFNNPYKVLSFTNLVLVSGCVIINFCKWAEPYRQGPATCP